MLCVNSTLALRSGLALFITLSLLTTSLLWNWQVNLDIEKAKTYFSEFNSELTNLKNQIKTDIGDVKNGIAKLEATKEQGEIRTIAGELNGRISKEIRMGVEAIKERVSKLDKRQELKRIENGVTEIQGRISKLETVKQQEFGQIETGIDNIKFRVAKLEEVNQQELHQINTRIAEIKERIPQVVTRKREVAAVSNVSQVSLPNWIERFAAPHWSGFVPSRGVFVFFVTYRHEYLRLCLDSIAAASADIDKSSVCVFALDKPPKQTKATDVNKTMAVIHNVTFCEVVVWKVDSDRGERKEKNSALHLKLHWWFVLKGVFNATMTGNLFGGSLLGYKHDILFVEEDAVLAPDFIKVMWFASEVKRRNADIIQLAFGGWSGENTINAHPDTFVVRTSRVLRGIAYALNQSNWFYFETLEKDFLDDVQHDWCESMGMVLGKHNGRNGFRIVVPTLSRIWHIGKIGLGPGRDFNSKRGVTMQPNWAHASRLIELKSASINLGLRDMLGFLCKKRLMYWFLKDMECIYSMARWEAKYRNKIVCAKQPYLTDPCDAYIT